VNTCKLTNTAPIEAARALTPHVHPFDASPGTAFADIAFEKLNNETDFHKRNRGYEH